MDSTSIPRTSIPRNIVSILTLLWHTVLVKNDIWRNDITIMTRIDAWDRVGPTERIDQWSICHRFSDAAPTILKLTLFFLNDPIVHTVDRRWNRARASLTLEASCQRMEDVRSRIRKARQLTRNLKMTFFKSNCISVFSYGCGTWKMTSNIENQIHVFINGCLRIRWASVTRNEE